MSLDPKASLDKLHFSSSFGRESLARRLCVYAYDKADRTAVRRGTEIAILLLIVTNVVVLTIQSARDVYSHPRPSKAGFFYSWEDYVLFALFVCFTIELCLRILVSGLIFDPTKNPSEYSEDMGRGLSVLYKRIVGAGLSTEAVEDRHTIPKNDAYDESRNVSMLSFDDTRPSKNASGDHLQDPSLPAGAALIYPPVGARFDSTTPSLLSTRPPTHSAYSIPEPLTSRTVQTMGTVQTNTHTISSKLHEDVPFVRAIEKQRHQNLNHQRAFLRHSWNRLDAVAVISFWISFLLALSGVESRKHLYLFSALSTLRAARLLTITDGTTVRECWHISQALQLMSTDKFFKSQTILRSLKQAAPLMLNVAFFVVFAMALFR